MTSPSEKNGSSSTNVDSTLKSESEKSSPKSSSPVEEKESKKKQAQNEQIDDPAMWRDRALKEREKRIDLKQKHEFLQLKLENLMRLLDQTKETLKNTVSKFKLREGQRRRLEQERKSLKREIMKIQQDFEAQHANGPNLARTEEEIDLVKFSFDVPLDQTDTNAESRITASCQSLVDIASSLEKLEADLNAKHNKEIQDIQYVMEKIKAAKQVAIEKHPKIAAAVFPPPPKNGPLPSLSKKEKKDKKQQEAEKEKEDRERERDKEREREREREAEKETIQELNSQLEEKDHTIEKLLQEKDKLILKLQQKGQHEAAEKESALEEQHKIIDDMNKLFAEFETSNKDLQKQISMLEKQKQDLSHNKRNPKSFSRSHSLSKQAWSAKVPITTKKTGTELKAPPPVQRSLSAIVIKKPLPPPLATAKHSVMSRTLDDIKERFMALHLDLEKAQRDQEAYSQTNPEIVVSPSSLPPLNI